MFFPPSGIADLTMAGERMYSLAGELFGWHRAKAGAGLRRSLERLAEEIPLELHEVPSSERAFDFSIPLEWDIHDAYVADESGQRVIDYRQSNLHVISDSRAVHKNITWRELKSHLHSLADRPDSIPFRSAHFRDEWGFCLRHRDKVALAHRGEEEVYEVCIDVEHRPGSLSYGECFIPGESDDEMLVSAHICHPSLANDNLSGVVVAAALGQHIASWPRRHYGYRILFAPATIGALAWLSRNEKRLPSIRHGLVLAQVGDSRPLSYKRSRRHRASIDHVMTAVVSKQQPVGEVHDFQPWGYDERQFCSPAFNLPIGRLSRSSEGEYPEYHTSADNMDFISPQALAEALACCLQAFQLLEMHPPFTGTQQRGEPQLGHRGLYAAYGEQSIDPCLQKAVLWTLNLADGRHTLVDVEQLSGLPHDVLCEAFALLQEHDLVRSEWEPEAALVQINRDNRDSLQRLSHATL